MERFGEREKRGGKVCERKERSDEGREIMMEREERFLVRGRGRKRPEKNGGKYIYSWLLWKCIMEDIRLE